MAEAAVSNPDVSDLVVTGAGLPAPLVVGSVPTDAPGLPDAIEGGLRYVLPTLAPGILLGYAVVARRPRLLRTE